MKPNRIFSLLLSLLFIQQVIAQNLTISASGGDVGPISGTNWGISANVLYVGSSGSASINTSVITNHLANTGDLTINLPGQLNVARIIYINNTIAYSGSSARTLTFQSGNDIVFANAVGITSATASLNIVLRSATTPETPNNGSVKMDGINIDTKGGHLWVGGGASTTTWNGLYVGNSVARTYLDDVAGISVVGSTIASGGGNIYMNAQSWNSTDDDGVNYGLNVENSSISSGTGSINFSGGVYGRYNNGIGMRVNGTSAASITSTAGAITIYGYGTDATTNGNLWRTATMINGSVSIKSGSGNIAVTGQAAFASPVNDKEGLVIGDGSAICSQTGNITLNGTNTLESSGQYSNSIRFSAANVANSIRIGYDGTNAYSGNISIEGNSIYQRSAHAGAGSIAIQSTGTLTIQPTGNAFTYMRAGDAGTLTFDNDWNFGTNLGGFAYGKTTNTTALSYSNALTTSGPITIYAGSISQNAAFSTSSSTGHIRLHASADIAQAAALTSQGGSIVLWSDTDGTSGGRIGISANMATNGGHLYVGGGSASETLNGMNVPSGYAASSTNTLSGISVAGSTINSSGGNIRMKGLNNSINGTNTGIIVSNNSTISSGAGSLALYGQRTGAPNLSAGLFLGTEINSGIATGNVTISSTSGDIYLEGITTGVNNSYSWCHGFAIVEYGGDDVSITSTTGNISMLGDASIAATYAGEAVGFVIQAATTTSLTNIATDGGSILINGKSSNTGSNFGSSYRSANATANISIGDNNTGNLTLQFGSLSTNAYTNSIALNSSGAYVIEGNSGASFASTIDFSNSYTLGSLGTSFRIGSTTNNQNVWMKPAVNVSGPITAYANEFILYNNLTSTSASDIGIYAKTHFWTYNVRQTIQTAGGNIYLYADADANGSGQLELDYLTFNPGTGATIIRGETVSFYTGSVNGPYINGTGAFTFQSSDASFGSAINTSWFEIDQDNNGIGGLTIGKVGSTADIQQDRTISAVGPVNMYGNNITFSSALTTTGDLSLYASAAVTQTSPIIAAGLSLNGTGTFTLTNISNNCTTLAGGAVGSLLGTTQIIDVSGGLTIGTVGSTTGLTGSSTIRVETLAGNITLAGSISTTSTSTDALILTSAKSTVIGVPSGGDIIVSGSPTITIGAGAIAKLYSGYDVTSTGLTALVGGATNARYNYDETSTTYNPTLSANNKYAIYRTAFGFGDLNIVSSGGDAEGTTWTYVNGVITTTSGTANVLNTDVQTKLNAANLSIEANKITFSASVTGTTSNTFNVLSKTHIVNTNATTISTQGGNVLFASNVDDATDGESTTNGYINLRFGITINSNGGNITLGGGNTAGSDYSLGSSTEAYTEGIRFDIVIALNSGGGNIALRGKSYAMGVQVGYGAAGIGFYFFSAATGTINSGTGTITIDGFSQTSTSTYASGIYSMHNINITSANTTANAIRLIGKATGVNGDAVGIETESIFSVFATGEGGGITISSSQQIADFYDVIFRGETNILAKSGPIQLLGKQDDGVANGRWYINNNFYLGSKALSAVPTSSSNLTIQYDLYIFSGYTPKLATSGTLNWKPASASFGQNVATDYFAWNQNSQTLSGLTIGKSGNTTNVSLNSAITVAGPVNVYGATIGITGALTASGSDVSLYASTAVTQSQPIVSSGLSLNGTGTFTLNNDFNNFTTLAGGAVGSLLGATDIVDVSGGLTIGTVGSNAGLTGSSTIRVETLAGNISLAGSISTTSTSSDAVILNAAKSTAIGIGTGGDIIVSGTPTITMGSGGIGKLFSGLEATSSGLTTLAGGSSNVRNNYDETTSTFSPVLSANNKYAIYRTSAGVGALTIVSSSGDAINTTWIYDNGVINTITTPVNILSSVVESYLASGPLTINAGNTTVNAAITSISSNALVLNANSTLSNTTPTTTVNAAITNAGPISINTGSFNIGHNISTTTTAVITISATNQVSSSTNNNTRRTIGTQGGNITINADNDANGSGWLDIDELTFNPGSANLIIRGETFNFNTTQTSKPYINGTGSFTFESNDAAFGQEIISNWFVLDQDANGMSGLTLGKSGSTANVTLNSVFTVAGPINAYGGLISVSSAITSSATGDILLKGITNSGSCINITAGITKSSGTGTLSMQGHGRVNNTGTISASGTGLLNVVMWSDYDGDNVGGGSTLGGGSISTNGGHIWMGGSNSSGGSYTWNGLAVGDGPSTGASGANCNAIDLFGPITTAGGDVLLWASNNGGCGISGIQSDGTRLINAGSGNITFISDQTAGAIELTSTGVVSLLPEGGSYASALTLGGALTSGNYTFNTSHYNGLKINSLANSGLVIGSYSGHLSGVTAVTQGNTSTVTASTALSTKSLEIYGGAVVASAALTAAGNIILDGGTVTLNENISSSASGTISLYANALTISSGKTVTSSGQLIITPQSASTTIGIAGASGTLALPLTYFSTNFTDGFSNIQIGRNEHTAAISSNAFTLRDNMTFLTSGSLILGGLPIMGSNNVTLGSAISSISGMPTYYFQTNGTGEVIRSLSNTSTLQFPLGNSSYNPVSITNNSGSVDNFSVRVLDAIENNSNLSAATYVNRTWDIGKTTSNTGAGIAFTFNWNAGEIVNGTLANPILNHYGTYWETATGTSTAAAGSPILSLTHTGYMGTFSPFAISDASTPLPVSMASFNLNCSLEDVELKWQTASEHNSDYFQLETSLDGINWEIVQTIPAAGLSQELLNYSATDLDAARKQKYYRLKQVDFNGDFEMYGPLKADCSVESNNIVLYPNPCESHLTLSIDTQIPTELSYTIANPEGVVLETKKMAVQSGITLYTLDVSNYPGGMYILQFDLNEKRYIKKLTVQ